MTQAEHVRLQQLLLVPGVQVAEAGPILGTIKIEMIMALAVMMMPLVEVPDEEALEEVEVFGLGWPLEV